MYVCKVTKEPMTKNPIKHLEFYNPNKRTTKKYKKESNARFLQTTLSNSLSNLL